MIDEKIDAFLRDRTIDIGHSGRSLYQHLKGTHDLLVQYGEPERVCLGGLFHSIYGTNIFGSQAVRWQDRDQVREVIGDRAEHLAYVFCVCDRPRVLIEQGSRGPPYRVKDRRNGHTIPLTTNDLASLLAIEIANLVEQDAQQLVPNLRKALRTVKGYTLHY